MYDGWMRLADACSHLERRHYAKGQCRTCYLSALSDRVSAERASSRQARAAAERARRAAGLVAPISVQKNRVKNWRNAGVVGYPVDGQVPDQPCDICQRIVKLCLDHDHGTGQMRGWLCRTCNTALGRMRDDPVRLARAVAYLRRIPMSLPGLDCDVKSSGRACDTWSIEWTYSDGSGAPVLDTNVGENGAWTDEDPRVITPVADGGVGITLITFPKCRRVRVLHCSLQNTALGGAGERAARPAAVVPTSGTMTVLLVDYAGTAADPLVSSRGRLVLQLEYN